MASIAPELSIPARDEAFESLYRRYVEDVYHYALALLGNPADAEDVTQTTFLNAYRAFSRGEKIRKPQNWLIKIAHNVARTRYARSARRVKEVPLEDHVDHLSVPEEERPNVVGVLRALGRLPFNQRAALVMRELEGRSYGEISDTLGVSVPAVETLIFRARRSLRLRASALRSLGAVPVPASLTQLFGGGGAVAGGGALLGTGFLVKAAVALVAAAVATGLGGGQARRPVAARREAVAVSSAPLQSPAAVRIAKARPGANAVRGSRRATAPTAVVRPERGGTGPAASVAPAASATRSSPLGPSAPPVVPPASAPRITAPAAPPPVQEVVDTVENTVDTVASATSVLPVPPPISLPLPVKAPPLPKLP